MHTVHLTHGNPKGNASSGKGWAPPSFGVGILIDWQAAGGLEATAGQVSPRRAIWTLRPAGRGRPALARRLQWGKGAVAVRSAFKDVWGSGDVCRPIDSRHGSVPRQLQAQRESTRHHCRMQLPARFVLGKQAPSDTARAPTVMVMMTLPDVKPWGPASRAFTTKDVFPLAYLVVGVKVTTPLVASTATEPRAVGGGATTSTARVSPSGSVINAGTGLANPYKKHTQCRRLLWVRILATLPHRRTAHPRVDVPTG